MLRQIAKLFNCVVLHAIVWYFTALSCIDTVEVILSDWLDTSAGPSENWKTDLHYCTLTWRACDETNRTEICKRWPKTWNIQICDCFNLSGPTKYVLPPSLGGLPNALRQIYVNELEPSLINISLQLVKPGNYLFLSTELPTGDFSGFFMGITHMDVNIIFIVIILWIIPIELYTVKSNDTWKSGQKTRMIPGQTRPDETISGQASLPLICIWVFCIIFLTCQTIFI